MLKHYVEFMYPGTFVSESSVSEVKDRNASVSAPKECFGYRFFDREEVMSDNEVLAGQPKNYSGMHYFGRAMTLEQVKAEVPNSDILVRNMQGNKWNKVVRTRCGNFQPLTKLDKIVAEK